MKNSLASTWNRLISEEDAALDQWISVLVLAILAIIIFLALRDPITNMLRGAVEKVGTETNGLFNSQSPATGGAAVGIGTR
jgi:hypothetical protein